jgi:hypothetical protein
VASAASVLCAPPLRDATAATRKTAGRHGRTLEPRGPETGTRVTGISGWTIMRGRPAGLGQAPSGRGLPSGARRRRVGVPIHWGSCLVRIRTVRTRPPQMANSCYRPQFSSIRQCSPRRRRVWLSGYSRQLMMVASEMPERCHPGRLGPDEAVALSSTYCHETSLHVVDRPGRGVSFVKAATATGKLWYIKTRLIL